MVEKLTEGDAKLSPMVKPLKEREVRLKEALQLQASTRETDQRTMKGTMRELVTRTHGLDTKNRETGHAYEQKLTMTMLIRKHKSAETTCQSAAGSLIENHECTLTEYKTLLEHTRQISQSSTSV